MNATAQGETLHQACYTGALLAVQAFIDGGARCDVKDSDARTPLHWAAMAGHADIVRLLLQRPETAAVLNSQDDEGFGTLHSAAASGRALIIEQLIAAGADVNIRTRSGQTPLHYHKGRVPVIKALVIAMRDVDPRDMAGATPLHRAAGPGYTDAIRELLLHGGGRTSSIARCMHWPFCSHTWIHGFMPLLLSQGRT